MRLRVRSLAVLFCALLVACALRPAVLWAQEPDGTGAPDKLALLVVVVGFDGGGEASPDVAAATSGYAPVQGGWAAPYSPDYDWAAAVFAGDGALPDYYAAMSGGTFGIVPARETSAFGAVGSPVSEDAAGADGGVDAAASADGGGNADIAGGADVAGGPVAAGRANANVSDRANDGVVHVTLHEPYRAWGLVNVDNDVKQDFGNTVLRAFEAAGAYVDFESYDADGDGVISAHELAVAFIVPGYDASAFDDPARADVPALWPHAGTLAVAAQRGGAFALDSYIALVENLWYEEDDLAAAMQEPLGVLYHELGHYLGLPDLYALNEDAGRKPWGAYRVGALSLMDSGGWAVAGDAGGMQQYAPTALDGWSRYVLGWELPAIAAESGDYTVSSQWSDAGYRSLLIPTGDPDQYFLLENRQCEGADRALKREFAQAASAGGIVIWQVDKAVCRANFADNQVNDTTHHPGVMRLPFQIAADGRYASDLSQGVPDGDQPFFSAESCAALLGDAHAVIELPLYGAKPASGSEDGASAGASEGAGADSSGEGAQPDGAGARGSDGCAADEPEDRAASGVRLQFASGSGRDMVVHVEFEDDVLAASAHAGAGAEGRAGACEGHDAGTGEAAGSGAGNADGAASDASADGPDECVAAACAALAREVDADIALFDAGQARGMSSVRVPTPANAYAVLPTDQVIGRYLVSGKQMLTVLEQVSDESAGLTAGGVSWRYDPAAETGARVSDVRVGGQPLDEGHEYRVALPVGLARRITGIDRADRDAFMLAGSPADALRSFVQLDGWKARAAQFAGEVTYAAPSGKESAAGELDEGLNAALANLPPVFPWVIAAVLCLTLGAFATLVVRKD